MSVGLAIIPLSTISKLQLLTPPPPPFTQTKSQDIWKEWMEQDRVRVVVGGMSRSRGSHEGQ